LHPLSICSVGHVYAFFEVVYYSGDPASFKVKPTVVQVLLIEVCLSSKLYDFSFNDVVFFVEMPEA